MSIDRESYIPVHQQVAAILRQRIESGELRPGQKMPSETQVSQEFGIGRDTARDAFGVLRAEGLIETEKRVGSTVRVPPPVEPVDVPGPARITFRLPSPEERRRLPVGQGAVVVVIEREGEAPVLLASDRTELVIPR
ncbi:winged helix-turn-helix domain-containing protein [Nonomuraea soli]|uniref:GntR family transcriptional regulator n=1 Tax=Nonomuraea soli TaxID=1032476 RepID=A0A7W0HVP2_9ACTN|nr:winged helix-turn-helix domain-containing protein [Nonomuraea soli]MBA2897413.1 GntR family transcriptional regulator [Nonomuraea soli]